MTTLTNPRRADLLGAYVLPGPAMEPLEVIPQTEAAERLGLGSVWLSELQGPLKDAGAILGIMGHITTNTIVGTSISHFGTRHPMANASWGATMQVLTGNRFVLGFGRSVPYRWVNYGVPIPTIPYMEDHANILRRLWAGEVVSYDGPAGNFPQLHLGEGVPGGAFSEFTPPPIMLAAIGPKTLELVGRAFDGVCLHPFLTAEGVARSRAIIHKAAEDAGRDPEAITIYHELVCAPDFSERDTDFSVGARAAAYFTPPGYCELIFEMNGWDTAPLGALREEIARAMKENHEAGEPLKGREILMAPSRTMPREWITTGAAIGSAADVAARLHEYLDAGADRVIIHGATPDRLESTVRAFA